MNVLKIITTGLIALFMLPILFFSKGLNWKRNKISIVGFGLMELTYLLSLICIWSQKRSFNGTNKRQGSGILFQNRQVRFLPPQSDTFHVSPFTPQHELIKEPVKGLVGVRQANCRFHIIPLYIHPYTRCKSVVGILDYGVSGSHAEQNRYIILKINFYLNQTVRYSHERSVKNFICGD